MKFRHLLIPIAALVAACDAGSAGAPSGSDADATADATNGDAAEEVHEQVFPAAPDGGQQLLSDRYTLQSGTEKYFCYTFHSPADEDVGITAVGNLAGKLVHHVVLFQAIAPEQEGFHECNTLIKLTWMPIWAGGRGANDLGLPPKVAFKVTKNTQYVVQYHLLNAGVEAVTEKSGINLTYVHDLTDYQPAGIFAFGNFSLDIPHGAVGYQQTVGCQMPQDMHVFAVFPHMHLLGKKLELFQGPTQDSEQTAYKIDPWPFGDQPFDKVDLQVKAGDYMEARCTWDNPGDQDVVFGESTFNEMCFTVLFAYPITDIGGCGF